MTKDEQILAKILDLLCGTKPVTQPSKTTTNFPKKQLVRVKITYKINNNAFTKVFAGPDLVGKKKYSGYDWYLDLGLSSGYQPSYFKVKRFYQEVK